MTFKYIKFIKKIINFFNEVQSLIYYRPISERDGMRNFKLTSTQRIKMSMLHFSINT